MAKSVLDGTNLILSVDNKALGFSTGCKVSTSTETGERVTKEAASGKWKEKYVKSFSESISADGCVLTDGDDDMPTYDQLKEKMLKGIVYNVPGKARVEIETGTKKLYRGEVQIVQFGTREGLAPVMFDDKKAPVKVFFYPETGAIKQIIQ